MQVKIFNYNTSEKVHAFEAHSDYLRSIAVHPTQPYILTSSGELALLCWLFMCHLEYIVMVDNASHCFSLISCIDSGTWLI